MSETFKEYWEKTWTCSGSIEEFDTDIEKSIWNHQQSKIDKLETLLKEACEFVSYAERDKYKGTFFTRFLNKPEIQEIIKDKK